jgi:hypothetical protein
MKAWWGELSKMRENGLRLNQNIIALREIVYKKVHKFYIRIEVSIIFFVWGLACSYCRFERYNVITTIDCQK